MVQACFWNKIKRILPGFVQGLTKKEMIDLFKSRVSTLHSSISIDGSAFDGSQFASLMEIADNKFWDIAHDDIVKILDYNGFADPILSAENMVREAQKTDLFMFTRLKGVRLLTPMTNAMKKSLSRCKPGITLDYTEWF